MRAFQPSSEMLIDFSKGSVDYWLIEGHKEMPFHLSEMLRVRVWK